jgi:sugar O-acyltransferase (sialic acid O-acetyltransferase NeuD family)
MMDFGVFGTSGHAREVADIAHALGYRVIHVARDRAEFDAWTFPDEVMLESDVGRTQNLGFAIGIGDNAVRQQVAERFAGIVRFGNLIHPSATFGQRQREVAEAGRGVVICAGARLTNNIRVGNFTIFNRSANIGHDVIVDDFVHVAPGACVSGNVHLGTRCWIGASAVVNQGMSDSKLVIGADTVIGSGCVVIDDCEPHAVYVGIPAKRIK